MKVVSALRAQLPSHAVLSSDEDTTPYECDGLTAYRQRPLVVALPEDEAQVQAVLRTCHSLGVPVVARGAGTGPVRRRHAECGGRDAVAREVQPHPQGRSRQPHGGRAMRRAQPRHQRGRRAVQPLLRARSFEPDRLHHRRQRRRKLGRRALPQVRPDAAQRPARARVHRRGRTDRIRQRGARLRRARPAGAGDRQRRHAGRDDRGHRQAGAQAATGALHHGQLRRRAKGRRRRGRRDRSGHHPGRPGDDGQADDRGGRGLRPRRLRPRRRRDPAVRIRRHARGSRGRNRPHDATCCAAAARRPSR